MAIYADKKNGQLTGRWRVELQRGKERYRQRHDSHDAAVADEKRVRALWGQGGTQVAPEAPKAPSGPCTLSQAMDEAKGSLWRGKKTSELCWQRMEHIKSIIGGHTPLENIDALKCDKLVTELDKRGKAPGTINRYLSNLRTFLTWCIRRELRSTPIKEDMIDWQDEPNGRIRWITHEEEQQMYAFLEGRQGAGAKPVRDLIEIALETGCRRNELLTAELDQINGNRLHLWDTKTSTPRTVPMTERTTALLTNLIETKTMPSLRGLRNWWMRLREHMGMNEDPYFVFHACRHTRATRMVDAGINVFVIKEWMGHKRLETTLRYAHVRPQNLEAALVKVGDFMAGQGGKPQTSAAPTVPQGLPHGGEMGHLAQAA